MLLLQDELKKTRFKQLLKDPYFLAALSAILVNIPSLLITNINFLRFIAAFTVTFESVFIKRQVQILRNTEYNYIKNILVNTTTYKECEEEYNKYIEQVAKLIRGIGLTSSKEIILYLEMLMLSGCFSKNHTHTYHDFKYEYVDIASIAGARVLTGKSVCRHQSSFFVDVLNNLGFESTNITVTRAEKDPVQLAKSRKKKWNHAVVGIADQGEMYLFDTTSSTFCTRPTNIDFSELESILVSEYVSPLSGYLVMNPQLTELNKGHELHYHKIMNTKQAQITKEESDFLKERMKNLFKANEQAQYEFHLEQEKLRNNIDSLYTELIPHQDTPIKEWILRR